MEAKVVGASCRKRGMGRRRRGRESFAEWAVRGLIRGVAGIALALLATYLIYRVVMAAFAEATR